MKGFCDSHTDFMTKLRTFEEKEKYVNSIKKYGAQKIVSAIFTTDENIGIEKLKVYKNEIDKLNGKFGNLLYFSIEDLESINPNELEELAKLKPFSTTLTWNKRNIYGGGAKSNAGLSQEGIDACKLLEKNNIFIDTAHLNPKSFWQICSLSSKPILNSHSNIYALCKNKRNLTYEQIKQIVSSNGFMGITFYQKFISKKQISCHNIASQFAYLSEKFGTESFGLGTDLFGFDKKFLPADLKSYEDIKILENEMKNVGFSNNETNKILCNNFINFLQRNNILKDIDK